MEPLNRSFVMGDEALLNFYHEHWRQIDRDWRGEMTEDTLGALIAIQSERDALRAQIREMAPGMGGPYLIPV